jgi:hypothetical protein
VRGGGGAGRGRRGPDPVQRLQGGALLLQGLPEGALAGAQGAVQAREAGMRGAVGGGVGSHGQQPGRQEGRGVGHASGRPAQHVMSTCGKIALQLGIIVGGQGLRYLHPASAPGCMAGCVCMLHSAGA